MSQGKLHLRVIVAGLVGTCVAAGLLPFAIAQSQSALGPDVSSLSIGSPVTLDNANRPMSRVSRPVNVAVRLSDPPLLQRLNANAKRVGASMPLADRQAYVAGLRAKQDALLVQLRALGGQELGRLTTAGNMVVVTLEASKLPQVARLPGVSAMLDVRDYTRSLETTVPYTGAAALQAQGRNGLGVKVAVLDSGIDYTHAEFGGGGTIAAFNAAAGNPTAIEPGTFPTAKVIAGIDFVGEAWSGGGGPPLAPDADPIDAGPEAGHGTHVADIIAGQRGMAPGASLMAVKVCSSVSTACSGAAILNGLEWIADPNGDLDFSDTPDIFNMSLGAAYGQRENPANELISTLARFGMVPVISAGNSADRPYILGGPSNTPEAISVAQTAMPGAIGYPLVVLSPASIAGSYANTNTVDWAPITTGFTGVVRRAGAAGSAAALACTLADTIDFTGTVALIDRGVCAASIKVENAALRGAVAVIIANNAAGDAPTFSFGGGTTLVQTLIVTQTTGNTLKTVPTNTASVTVGPGSAVPLVGSMASTSSRGPTVNFSAIKPEIGAPGASLSAEYGTGNGRTAFGGTSGAAPMVAGAAALLLQQSPNATPTQIKARLMNSAETNIFTNPQTLPGELAPISRIGGGELRANRAAALQTIAWDAGNPAGVGASFGTIRIGGPPATYSRKIAVQNLGNSPRVYNIATSFRYANDQANGAVSFSHPPTISVPANGTAAFTLSMRIDPALLPVWNTAGLNAASNQGTGSRLQLVEYDGYLRVSDSTEAITLPWHVLPHKAANLVVGSSVNMGGANTGAFPVSNLGGSVAGATDVFALTGTSAQQSPFALPYGGGVVMTDLKAVGVRSVDIGGGALGLQFAIATYGERAHPAYPGAFEVTVDTNNDGIDDFVIFNAEIGAFGTDGRTAVFCQALTPGASASALFFAIADLNSSHITLTVPGSCMGLTSAAQRITFSVLAGDNRISGLATDFIGPMTVTVGTPRYRVTGGTTAFSVPIGVSGSITVEKVAGGDAASPSQTGLLLLHRDAKSNRESDTILITP